MKELNLNEIEQVSGAIDNDVGWAASVGAAVAFVGIAATIYATAPIMGVAFAGASLVSSGVAMDFAWMSGGGYSEFVPDLTRRRG